MISRSRAPDSSSSAWTLASATRVLPALAGRGREHLAHQRFVETRSFRDPPAQPHEIDLAVRLLPEMEGREARGRLGVHVEREPGSVGLAVGEPVLQLLLAQ